jgi:hypothetical protein
MSRLLAVWWGSVRFKRIRRLSQMADTETTIRNRQIKKIVESRFGRGNVKLQAVRGAWCGGIVHVRIFDPTATIFAPYEEVVGLLENAGIDIRRGDIQVIVNHPDDMAHRRCDDTEFEETLGIDGAVRFTTRSVAGRPPGRR